MSDVDQRKKESVPLLKLFVSLFCIALLFKMLHWPFASFLAILAVFSCWVSGSYFTIKALIKNSSKEQLVKSLLTLAIAAFLTFVLFRIQMWALSNVALVVAGVFLIFYAAVSLLWQPQSKRTVTLIIFMSAVIMLLDRSPAHRVYKVVYMNELLNSKISPSNYDRYSWFLILAGEKEAALQANSDALNAIDTFWSEANQNVFETEAWADLIADHRYIIENERSLDLWVWDIYRP